MFSRPAYDVLAFQFVRDSRDNCRRYSSTTLYEPHATRISVFQFKCLSFKLIFICTNRRYTTFHYFFFTPHFNKNYYFGRSSIRRSLSRSQLWNFSNAAILRSPRWPSLIDTKRKNRRLILISKEQFCYHVRPYRPIVLISLKINSYILCSCKVVSSNVNGNKRGTTRQLGCFTRDVP